MKKNEKITKYFDNLARNYYRKNVKVDNDFFKFIASKINSSDIYCKSEYRKAQVKLYNRISYFRKNKNIILLSEYTGISVDDLLKFFISGDLKLTKTNIETLRWFYNLSEVSIKNKLKNDKLSVGENNKNDVQLILPPFLIHLKKQLKYQYRTDGRVNAQVMQDGTIFYSNNAIYQALKTYFTDVTISSLEEAKQYMIQLVDKLRNANLLAKKINKGYYSNSFIFTDEEGRARKEFGIFIKNIENSI